VIHGDCGEQQVCTLEVASFHRRHSRSPVLIIWVCQISESRRHAMIDVHQALREVQQ
jgi:hypothetical protein